MNEEASDLWLFTAPVSPCFINSQERSSTFCDNNLNLFCHAVYHNISTTYCKNIIYVDCKYIVANHKHLTISQFMYSLCYFKRSSIMDVLVFALYKYMLPISFRE